MRFFAIFLTLTISSLSFAQTATLKVQFDDAIAMHNFGIAFDGTYYYTNNGGNATVGAINKYNNSGALVASYDIDLDMRGIMYNRNDGGLYVSTYSRDIYKITNLSYGYYTKVLTGKHSYEQSTPAFDPSGRYLYAFSAGTLSKYSFPSGQLVKTFSDLKHGSGAYGGDGAVAVSEDHIYTWDASSMNVYVYDLNGTYQKSMTLSKGDCGFSLSYTNGMLFTATDGNGGTGKWYGYDVGSNRDASGSATLTKQFDDKIPMHNFNMTYDGSYYYTCNGGNASSGTINKYSENGGFLNSVPVTLDMRSIMYSKSANALYAATYGAKIYKINNDGSYELVLEGLYSYNQASPSLDPSGRNLYVLEEGTIYKYSFPGGKLIQKFPNIKSGSSNYGGDGAIAVSDDNIYTWDSNAMEVYVYDLRGNYQKSLKVSQGNCGFSLKYENGMLWTATDGNGGIGTWFGYNVGAAKKKTGKSTGGTDN